MKLVTYNNGKHKTLTLKIKKTDYLEMAGLIHLVLKQYPNSRKTYKEQGLSDMRFRWDCLHASGFNTCRLYDYLDDNHIDTALKHIVE